MTRQYEGNDNQGNPKSEYVSGLTLMTDPELQEHTKVKIWLSAFAGNNPRSDYHWQVGACYDECERRGKENGLYGKAYKDACGTM